MRRGNGLFPVRLRDEMDRVFGDFWGPALRVAPFVVSGRGGFPALNVWEDERNLYAEAEVPGLGMEDLEVFVVGNELTIKGERKDVENEGSAYHRRERGVGAFCRVIQLPIEVNADQVEANLKDGVLAIRLPKAESVLPRKIPVTG